MSRRVVAVVVILALVGALAVPLSSGGSGLRAAAADDVTTPAAPSARPALSLGATEFDRTLYSIRVFRNGSARWTFQYVRELQNDTERANFEQYAAEFRTNRTDLYDGFVDRARALTQAGTNATGRRMNATNFARDARVRPLDEVGIVEMSFTWSAFGQQRDGGVLVSDVFAGGLYLRPEQRLRFVTGPELAFETVEPQPTSTSAPTVVGSQSITWEGERTFTDRHPYVAFQPVSALATATATTGEGAVTAGRSTDESTTTAGSGTDGDREHTTAATGAEPGGYGRLLLVLVALTLVGLGVVAAAWINGILDVESSGTDSVDAQGPATGSEAATPETVPEEPPLLDDSDRVLQLLEDHDGRMKQTEIVDRTEWSKSKVSMLLSDMEDDGDISKLRVGRENIISLPGDEPEAAGSPFDEGDAP